MKKDNNIKKFPGEISRNRPDKAHQRRIDAENRQLANDNLSLQQRIEKLDNLFGKGIGATKERVKIEKLLANPPSKKPEPIIEVISTNEPELVVETITKKRKKDHKNN